MHPENVIHVIDSPLLNHRLRPFGNLFRRLKDQPDVARQLLADVI